MQQTRLIGFIVLGICLIIGVILSVILWTVLQDTRKQDQSRINALNDQIAIQAQEITTLSTQMKALREEQKLMNETIATLQSRSQQPSPRIEMPTPQDTSNQTTEDLIGTVDIRPQGFNKGLIQPKNAFMIRTLGQPRQSYGTNCQPVTNPRLVDAMTTQRIGNFRVTMLKPAMASFSKVMERLKTSDPDIFEKVGTAGALCARLIRGSNSSVSNHSWGTAIDIKLDNTLDQFADGETQFGLLIIAEYFNDEGWYWGASYGREDSMHFEASEALIQSWVDAGQL